MWAGAGNHYVPGRVGERHEAGRTDAKCRTPEVNEAALGAAKDPSLHHLPHVQYLRRLYAPVAAAAPFPRS